MADAIVLRETGFAVSRLGARSTTVTRPMLFHFTAEADDRNAMAADLFKAISEGTLRVDTPRTYPIADAAGAHRDLEARATAGSVVLTA